MKLLSTKILISLALLANACGYDENSASLKSSAQMEEVDNNENNSLSRNEIRAGAEEFFAAVIDSAENSSMIDIWKMAINENLTTGREAIGYSDEDGSVDMQIVKDAKINLVKTKLVSLLGKEQKLEGIYTDTGFLSLKQLTKEMLRKTFPVVGKPVYVHVFDELSPLVGYQIVAYPATDLGLGAIILIGQLPFSSNGFDIKLEPVNK